MDNSNYPNDGISENNYPVEGINEGMEQETDRKPPVKGPMKEILEWVQAIAIAVVLAIVIRSFVFNVVRVSGPSMESTLHDGDRMVIWKLFDKPERGDIVVVKSAQTVDDKGKQQFWIKRVIATEGQHVEIDYEKNEVRIDGEPLNEPYINNCKCDICGGDPMKPLGEISDIVVPKGCVFVMGDNRNHSKDSRAVGSFSVDSVEGEAVLRFWPIGKFKTY